MDYRTLNKVIITDKFPNPRVDNLINELHGLCIFAQLDLKSWYHQIQMWLEDMEKTPFQKHVVHYVPFGLKTALATFQSLMNGIFKKCLHKYMLVFFDNILVHSMTEQDHRLHHHEVFMLLRGHQL